MLILAFLSVSPLLVKIFFDLGRTHNSITIDNEKTYNKRFLIVCGILITFIMGFRGMLSGSPDTAAYVNFFTKLGQKDITLWAHLEEQIQDKIWIFAELGFSAFMWILSRITQETQAIILVTSAFIVYSVMRFIYKNSKNVMLSVVLFLCLGLFSFSMNGMRQALAMAICLWAYEHVKNGRVWKFLLTVFIAMLFHKTAIVFFVVYFIKFLKFDRKSIVFFLIMLGVFVVLMPTIVQYLDEVYDKNYSDSTSRDSGGFVQVIIYLIVILLALIFKDTLKGSDGKNYLYLTLLAFFFYLLRFFGSQIFERISYFFSYFLIVFVPNIIETCGEKDKWTLNFAFVFFSILLFIYRSSSVFSNFYFCF